MAEVNLLTDLNIVWTLLDLYIKLSSFWLKHK